MNVLLYLLAVPVRDMLAQASLPVSTLFCRDAIAEHNTDRCYVTKTEGMAQFPDVKPHSSVSQFELSFEMLRLCQMPWLWSF